MGLDRRAAGDLAGPRVTRSSKGVTGRGRSRVRRPAGRRIPGAGAAAARCGAVVNELLANVAGGVLALLLIGYLFVALIRPERF